MRLALALAVALAAGCTDQPPDALPPPALPSCEQAIAHYYAAGCTYAIPFDPPVAPEPIPRDQFTGFCNEVRTIAPSACQPMLDELIECSMSTTSGDCSCQELYASMHC